MVVDKHRAGIISLKRIAECCLKEAETWTATITSLHKAKQEEENAVKRALMKEEKAAEKRAQKEQAKRDREERQKADKAAKALAAAEAGEDGNKKGSGSAANGKRRRTGGQEDLDENDPLILREMSKFGGGSMAFFEDLDDFTKAIAAQPEIACACRLKKAAAKKAMLVPRLNQIQWFWFSSDFTLSSAPMTMTCMILTYNKFR